MLRPMAWGKCCGTAVLALLLAAGVALAQSHGKAKVANDTKEDSKQAQQLAERGDGALAAGKMNEALADYEQAVKHAPGDAGIVHRAAAVRAQVVQKLVDQAESDALDGFLAQATDLMYEALKIDPGNAIVAERLAQMKQMPKEYLPRGDKEDYEMRGAAALKPQPGKKAVNVRGDSKSAYEQVAQMYGITVAFDPDLTSKNIRLRVNDVDFYTAMQLLGVESKTFYRAVNSKLMFVAEDTIAKRKEYAEEVEQTFRLDNTVAPEDLTEMVRVIREITNSTRMATDPANHTLTVRESADKVALAGQLIRELEQSRRDVMLDIELLEVDRNTARTLGITPPSSVQAFPLNSKDVAQLEQATDIANLLTLVAQVFSARGITASPTDVLPVGGGKSTFLLTMPSASATFSTGLSLVKSGRQILMRAQDSKAATFFVGQRFPVTLSLLSTSLGGTTVGAAVSSTVFARTDFAVGKAPVAVVTQDFNNDSKLDLAVVNQADSSISILFNNDNGNFTAPVGSPIVLGASEQLPSAIASKIFRITDATHLVQPADLVVANSGSNTVSVLLGSENFDGTFTEAVGSPFAVGINPSGVVIADFNGDGFLDFAVVNQGDDTISVFQGDGQGGFTPFPKSPFALPTTEKGPIAVLSGTFDNSGKPEIAVLNLTTQNIGIFQASGINSGASAFDGTFAELSGSPVATGADPVAFATGDLNADGIDDFAVVNQSQSEVTVLLNDTTGFFTAAAGSPLATAATPAGVAIADFTNDGVGDIAVTNNGASTLGVYAGLGSEQFSQRIELSTPPGPLALTTAQLTSSGLPDAILTASSGSNNFVTVLLDPSSFAAGAGSVQTPYPGSEYIDLGIKVKATPSLHVNNEVTLQLEFEIRALAGSSVNGIPVITNRTVSQTVRLKEGEPSIVAGLLDNEETKALNGIPGLANLPGVGYAFGQRSTSLNDTELLIVVTPRRMSDRVRTSVPRFAGRGGATSPGTAAPTSEP
ncbi:MAG TPA: FG-GAP-like repeat-containing protein [Candidatus Acidoferrum sp.]|nr:FG-GAP-like repeat-containing protein [Candidatus Acidoferrum sp.]